MATRQDLRIEQGATWSFTWTKRDGAGAVVNLTGYAARMSIKRCVGGGLHSFLSSDTAQASGGSITLGGSAGTVLLAMTAVQSAAFGSAITEAYGFTQAEHEWDGEDLRSWASFEYRYDLELVSPAGVVTRELEGQVILSPEVTAP